LQVFNEQANKAQHNRQAVVMMGLFDGLKKAIGNAGTTDNLATVEAENAALIKLYQERVTRINNLEVITSLQHLMLYIGCIVVVVYSRFIADVV